MDTSKQACILSDEKYKGDELDPKLSYSKSRFNNVEVPHLPHVNESKVSNGYGEIYSPTGSISSSDSVEIPYDIPDCQKFHDLGAYIDSVVIAYNNESLNPCTQSCHNGVIRMENPGLTESDFDTIHNIPTNASTTDALNVFHDLYTGENFVEEFADFVSDSTVGENWAVFPSEINQDAVNTLDNKSPELNSRNSSELNDTEDFGDFTHFSSTVVSAPVTNMNIDSNREHPKERQPSSPGILERLLQKLGPSLDKAFGSNLDYYIGQNPSPSTETAKIDTLSATINSSVDTSSSVRVSLSQVAITNIPNNRIWSRLCSPDRLPEIHQQWWKSPIFMSYLSAIDVNPQNAIPAFASQLRLLEPIRLNSQNSHKTTTLSDNLTSQEDHVNTLLPTLVVNDKSLADNFIYNNNCIDTDNKTNQVLDLDFFETREIGKTSNNNLTNGSAVKHSELTDLEAELSAFTIPPPTPLKPPSLAIEADLKLFEINKRSKLSESVRSTLSRLPMINYMRTKRLMFPVQQQTQQENKD
ncbi:hypothetical protein MN116_007360 [Schistosoma mekongi]|uniref:Aftiphilin clathrin-binding box domain-containing protein n=1 Tax=Schistosoma mekongi TaxID=38744 RepID=A0AAE1Z934_SCHME|nr:hypothetical protein MN116_007360 [Schistosoma mekongi]